MLIKQSHLTLLFIAAIIVAPLLIMSAPATSMRSPVAPRRELVVSVVQQAYDKFKTDNRGKNADYIPYLAHVNPKLFGIAVVNTDNDVLTKGDVNYSFSIQSISKVYTLALAMEAL